MTHQFVSDGPGADLESPASGDRSPTLSLAGALAQPRPSVTEVIDAAALFTAIKQALAANLRADGAVVAPAAILAPRLARFALAGDLSAATDCLRRAIAARSRPAQAAAQLVEATAARVRDRWTKDRIPEVDVTVALCILQMALRSLCADNSVSRRASRGAVLVATPPEELHGLGAVLASEVFAEAGFDVLYRPSASGDELVALLRSTWVDAVTLHASPVFGRRERLTSLASLIGCVRAASRNPALVVAAQGACFCECGRGDADVTAIGADAAFPSSCSLLGWLSERLSGARTGAVACCGR